MNTNNNKQMKNAVSIEKKELHALQKYAKRQCIKSVKFQLCVGKVFVSDWETKKVQIEKFLTIQINKLSGN